MSYIRSGWPMKYVDGDSEDYVFARNGDGIEDYGRISDGGLVELLFTYWKTEDTAFKQHVLSRLAERLGVKLRKKPLTDKQEKVLFWKRIKMARKMFKNFKVSKAQQKRFDELKKKLARGESITHEELLRAMRGGKKRFRPVIRVKKKL